MREPRLQVTAQSLCCLNEKLHIKEKGNKSHHHYQMFHMHRHGSIDQNLSPSMTKETYD